MPRFSVLMPAYQAETTIAQAIASVQAQTVTDWELIVVDDGCTDGTIPLIQQAMASDNRIRLIQEGRTGILGQVRNRGIRHASGEYLNFLDSDDMLHPNALATLYDYLQTHALCKMAYGQFGMIQPDGRPYPSQPKGIVHNGNHFEVQHLQQPSWYSLLTSKTHNAVQSVLIRTTDAVACGGFPDDAAINCCDYVFFIRVAKALGIQAIHAVPAITFLYRQMPNSLSYGNADKLKRQIDTVTPMMACVYQPPRPEPMLALRSVATSEQYVQWMRSAARMRAWSALAYALQKTWSDATIQMPHKGQAVLKAGAFSLKALLGR